MKDRNLIQVTEDYLNSSLLKEDIYALDEKTRVATVLKVWLAERKPEPDKAAPSANLQLAEEIENRLCRYL